MAMTHAGVGDVGVWAGQFVLLGTVGAEDYDNVVVVALPAHHSPIRSANHLDPLDRWAVGASAAATPDEVEREDYYQSRDRSANEEDPTHVQLRQARTGGR